MIEKETDLCSAYPHSYTHTKNNFEIIDTKIKEFAQENQKIESDKIIFGISKRITTLIDVILITNQRNIAKRK